MKQNRQILTNINLQIKLIESTITNFLNENFESSSGLPKKDMINFTPVPIDFNNKVDERKLNNSFNKHVAPIAKYELVKLQRNYLTFAA